MVINIRSAFTQSYVNTFSKVSVLTSLAVQWLGLHAFIRRGPVQSPARELRSHKLHGAPHPKNLSVCGDPVCHLHQDWTTSTALTLGTHCSHKFLKITVAKLIFVLIHANIILIFGSDNCGF